MKIKNSAIKIGRFYSLVNMALFLSLIYCVNLGGGFSHQSDVSARRTRDVVFSEKWGAWQKLYEEAAAQNKDQALIDDLRSRWSQIRSEFYTQYGAEGYLGFLESELKGDDAISKVRALWEMRHIYFDLVDAGKEAFLGNLTQVKKEQLQSRILDNIINFAMQDIQGDFELWYNAKEVLTELLEDVPQAKNPREEVWKPALIASLKGLAKEEHQNKPWILDCITESINPVRIRYNAPMFELLLGLMDLGSSAWGELGLGGMTAQEKENIRKSIAKDVLDDMLSNFRNEIKQETDAGLKADYTAAYEGYMKQLTDAFKDEVNPEVMVHIAATLASIRDKIVAEPLLEVFDTLSLEKKKEVMNVLAYINYETDIELISRVKDKLLDIYDSDETLKQYAKEAITILIAAGFIEAQDIEWYNQQVSQETAQMNIEGLGSFGNKVVTTVVGVGDDRKLVMNIDGKEVVYKYTKPLSEMHSNPIDVYELEGTGGVDEFGRTLPQKMIVKSSSNLLSLNEYISSKLYSAMGIPMPRMSLAKEGEQLKIAVEFLEGYEVGSLFLPEQYHSDSTIQRGMFVSALVGDGDSAPWNIMFKEDLSAEGPDFYRIDAGGLITRATGRLVEFGANFGINDFNRVTSTIRHNQRLPVNEAYQRAKESFDILYRNAREFVTNISDEKIEEVLNQVFDEVNEVFGRENLVAEMEHWETLLQAELPYWYRKNAWDHTGAINTLGKIETNPGGLRQYYIDSLKARRLAIERLFISPGNIEEQQVFGDLIGNNKYRIVSIEQVDNVISYDVAYGQNNRANFFVFTGEQPEILGCGIGFGEIKSHIQTILGINKYRIKLIEKVSSTIIRFNIVEIVNNKEEAEHTVEFDLAHTSFKQLSFLIPSFWYERIAEAAIV